MAQNYVSLPGSSGNEVRAGSSDALNFDGVSTGFTLEVWASVPDWTPASRGQLIGKAPSNFASGWDMQLNASGSIALRYHDGAAQTDTLAATDFTNGDLGHIVVTKDFTSGNAVLFLNGVSRTTTAGSAVAAVTANALDVGLLSLPAAEWLQGNMYAARVYEGVSTHSNVERVFARGSGSSITDLTLVADPTFSIEGQMTRRFNEFTDTVGNVWDLSGTANYVRVDGWAEDFQATDEFIRDDHVRDWRTGAP
jgi:hypothetical protein